MLSYPIEVFLFIVSTGVFFNERFRQNPVAVLAAGGIAILSVWYLGKAVLDDFGYLQHSEKPLENHASPAPAAAAPAPAPPTPTPSPPAQPTPPLLQPNFKLARPESAILSNVVFPTVGSGTGGYALTNTGWDAPSITDIEVSLWALLDTGLTKIDSRTIPYLPKNGSASANGIRKPFPSGKFLLCLSYDYDSHHVEVLRYYTNEPDPSFPMSITLREFRNPKYEIDGPGRLCKSLPQSESNLPVPPAPTSSTVCLVVNGRQVCE
jgi:hypothetical protein